MTTKTKQAPAAGKNTLRGNVSSIYGKELFLAPAKCGKTLTIMGGLLGVMPWQEYGGVISDPKCLHIITFDAATLDGAYKFLTEQCGAPDAVGDVDVHNLQQAAAEAFRSTTEYDGTFPSKVYETLAKIQDKTTDGKVHAIMISSLTMCAKAWLRSISGPALDMRGSQMSKSPMDQNKWGLFAQQMTEFQFTVQADNYHSIWETHWAEKESKTKKDSQGNKLVLDTIQVQGQSNIQFPAQCERPYMLTRRKGGWKPGSKVDMVEIDTQPNLDFGESIMSGRKVVGVLEPKEKDLTEMFHKLGLRIGGWGT